MAKTKTTSEIIVTDTYLKATASTKGSLFVDCGDFFKINLVMVITVQMNIPNER